MIGKQLLRAGTSVGANYREGMRARSSAEMIAKFGICIQELEESAYWMELLVEAGCPTRAQPDEDARADIRRGIAVTRQLGRADAGQGCVVQQGLVLALEAIEGTDAMLARAGTLRREGPGGVLVKLVKPQQTALLDLPAIGPATLRAAAAAGLRGLAIEARRDGHVGTIVVDRDATICEADAAGLFLAAIDADRFLQDQAEETTP